MSWMLSESGYSCYIYIEVVHYVLYTHKVSGSLITALSLPSIYDYKLKLCRNQAEVAQNHDNGHVRSIEQSEARHRTYKRLKRGNGQSYDC
jgi:hypothetical protein